MIFRYFRSSQTLWEGPSPACAATTEIWSAVTCHRFRRLGDLSPKQGCVQRPGEKVRRPLAFDGDKSPAKSGDKSPHSKSLPSVREASSLYYRFPPHEPHSQSGAKDARTPDASRRRGAPGPRVSVWSARVFSAALQPMFSQGAVQGSKARIVSGNSHPGPLRRRRGGASNIAGVGSHSTDNSEKPTKK